MYNPCKSQKIRILDHLKNGGRITRRTAILAYNTANLAAVIHELRNARNKIQDEWILDPETHTKQKVYFMA